MKKSSRFNIIADENNEINQASIEEFCNANRTAAFIKAVGNSAGNLVDSNCAVQAMFTHVFSDEAVTVTEGEFQVEAIIHCVMESRSKKSCL